MFRWFVFACLFLFTTACAQAKDVSGTPDFNGAWKNDMGSLAVFDIKDGVVRGTYQTNVGQPEKSKQFALIGFAQGDQITFTVNFKGFGSMTAWTGQMTTDNNGKPYIRTLWHLTRDVPDDKEQEDIWSSIITGASNFVQVNNSEGQGQIINY